MVELFVGGLGTGVEEVVGDDVFAVGVFVVVVVVDHVAYHDFDTFIGVFVGVELSDVEGSIFVLLSDFLGLLFDIDHFAGGVGTHIDKQSFIGFHSYYLSQFGKERL